MTGDQTQPNQGGNKTIILAAGGTGGHMAPADAVASVLRDQGHTVRLITDSRGDAYANMLSGIDRIVLSAKSTGRGGMTEKLKALYSILVSKREARAYLQKSHADILVGFGGYPSLPAVLAAKTLGLPYVLHEQNAVLGRVNRLLAKKAATLCLSAKNTKRVPKTVQTILTGNPVRREAENAVTCHQRSYGDNPRQILVLGGSQGARILSDIVPDALGGLRGKEALDFTVFHQARPEDVKRVELSYSQAGISAIVQPYFENVPEIMATSHVAICRAGASTIAELTATYCPAILVPLKIAADDHQTANASEFSELGGGWMIHESDFSSARLRNEMSAIFYHYDRLHMASKSLASSETKDAARKLADVILDLVKEKR